MSYEKQNFCDGQVLTAHCLNCMEDGIKANADSIGDVETALDSIIAIQNELIGGNSE